MNNFDSKDKLDRLDNEKNYCSDCGGKTIVKDYQRGDYICAECGMIISDQIIDDSPEWRSYNAVDNAKKSRIGSPMNINLHDKGLSTKIGNENIDGQGNKLSPLKNLNSIV